MPQKTFNLWIGGAAGDGIASCGDAFMKVCARSGIYAFAYNSYQSVIRGGHVLYQASAGSEKVWTQTDSCDILIALNMDTVEREAKFAKIGVLFNSDRLKVKQEQLKPGSQVLGLPISKLAPNPLMQNTVALGGFDEDDRS